WPPEPPTEKAMLAWPPPSELEEPATPAQAIPSWPESMHRASTQPSAPVPAAAAPTPPTITPPPQPEAVAPTAAAPPPGPPAHPAPPGPQPAPAPKPTPQAPIVGGQLPVAPVPATLPTTPAQPAPARSTWEVVEQKSKSGPHPKVDPGPTAEDRSYAEWFAWAKRGGAPASACHAAAQGAFKALSSGKDVSTAVQWATAAMSRPPENVSFTRHTYCAWFSLANI